MHSSSNRGSVPPVDELIEFVEQIRAFVDQELIVYGSKRDKDSQRVGYEEGLKKQLQALLIKYQHHARAADIIQGMQALSDAIEQALLEIKKEREKGQGDAIGEVLRYVTQLDNQCDDVISVIQDKPRYHRSARSGSFAKALLDREEKENQAKNEIQDTSRYLSVRSERSSRFAKALLDKEDRQYEAKSATAKSGLLAKKKKRVKPPVMSDEAKRKRVNESLNKMIDQEQKRKEGLRAEHRAKELTKLIKEYREVIQQRNKGKKMWKDQEVQGLVRSDRVRIESLVEELKNNPSYKPDKHEKLTSDAYIIQRHIEFQALRETLGDEKRIRKLLSLAASKPDAVQGYSHAIESIEQYRAESARLVQIEKEIRERDMSLFKNDKTQEHFTQSHQEIFKKVTRSLREFKNAQRVFDRRMEILNDWDRRKAKLLGEMKETHASLQDVFVKQFEKSLFEKMIAIPHQYQSEDTLMEIEHDMEMLNNQYKLAEEYVRAAMRAVDAGIVLQSQVKQQKEEVIGLVDERLQVAFGAQMGVLLNEIQANDPALLLKKPRLSLSTSAALSEFENNQTKLLGSLNNKFKDVGASFVTAEGLMNKSDDLKNQLLDFNTDESNRLYESLLGADSRIMDLMSKVPYKAHEVESALEEETKKLIEAEVLVHRAKLTFNWKQQGETFSSRMRDVELKVVSQQRLGDFANLLDQRVKTFQSEGETSAYKFKLDANALDEEFTTALDYFREADLIVKQKHETIDPLIKKSNELVANMRNMELQIMATENFDNLKHQSNAIDPAGELASPMFGFSRNHFGDYKRQHQVKLANVHADFSNNIANLRAASDITNEIELLKKSLMDTEEVGQGKKYHALFASALQFLLTQEAKVIDLIGNDLEVASVESRLKDIGEMVTTFKNNIHGKLLEVIQQGDFNELYASRAKEIERLFRLFAHPELRASVVQARDIETRALSPKVQPGKENK